MDDYNRSDFIIASLSQQVSTLIRQIAERDATITEQHIELKELREEQIRELDKESGKSVKKQK